MISRQGTTTSTTRTNGDEDVLSKEEKVCMEKVVRNKLRSGK